MKENRRDFFNFFLNGGKQKKSNSWLPLPPYNQDKSLFEKFCKDCEKPCVKACEAICQKGILKIFDGIPYVDFSLEGCKLCGECAKACPNGVLEEESESHWNFEVCIDELQCLGYHKTMCYTCKEACQSVLGSQKAIDFIGMFYPVINKNCIGCGFCVGVCPTQAIVLKERKC